MSGAANTTLPREFRRWVVARGDAPALRAKRWGIWNPMSWREAGDAVAEIAAGLHVLGLAPGEAVGVLAPTVAEAVLADLGAQTAGAVVACLHPGEPPRRLASQLAAARVRVLFVHDAEQLDRLREGGGAPRIEHLVMVRQQGLRGADDPRLLGLAQLREQGRAALQADAGLLDRLLAARQAHDAAAIVFTAGGGGAPRALRHSHAALLSACAALSPHSAPRGRGERLVFQPLVHAMERVGGVYAALREGAVLNFVESPDTVPDNLREVQPDLLAAPPRLWERLHDGLQLAMREATPLERRAFAWALALGRRRETAREAGRPLALPLRLADALARRAVLGNVRRMLGLDRLRLGLCAGGPVSPELLRWYRALGIDVRQAWALGEMAGYAAVADATDPPELCGRPLPGIELRISDEGELLIRAPALTPSPLWGEGRGEGDWLPTADAARLDAQGRLQLLGRLDDRIHTSDGRALHPAEVEVQLKSSPYIAEALVIGDGRAHLSCLLVPDAESLGQWAQERSLPFSDFRSLARSAEVLALLEAEVTAAGQRAGHAIRGFRLIDPNTDLDEDAVTPLLRLRRGRVLERQAATLQSLYAVAPAAPAATPA